MHTCLACSQTMPAASSNRRSTSAPPGRSRHAAAPAAALSRTTSVRPATPATAPTRTMIVRPSSAAKPRKPRRAASEGRDGPSSPRMDLRAAIQAERETTPPARGQPPSRPATQSVKEDALRREVEELTVKKDQWCRDLWKEYGTPATDDDMADSRAYQSMLAKLKRAEDELAQATEAAFEARFLSKPRHEPGEVRRQALGTFDHRGIPSAAHACHHRCLAVHPCHGCRPCVRSSGRGGSASARARWRRWAAGTTAPASVVAEAASSAEATASPLSVAVVVALLVAATVVVAAATSTGSCSRRPSAPSSVRRRREARRRSSDTSGAVTRGAR